MTAPARNTRLAIKKLRRQHLQATFFLVGKEIRACPGLAQREKPVAALGDHTMTQPVVLFRPPYEGHTAVIDREVKIEGHVIFAALSRRHLQQTATSPLDGRSLSSSVSPSDAASMQRSATLGATLR